MKIRAKDSYCRIGTDYFRIVQMPDRNGIIRDELKKWTKEEIKQDHGVKFIDLVPKFSGFVLHPDNNGGTGAIGDLYNLYAKFPHKAKAGEWFWTDIMLKHIFADQYDIALTYLKVIYQYPK